MMFQVTTNQARNQFTPKVRQALIGAEQHIEELAARIQQLKDDHAAAMRAHNELPFFKRILTEEPTLETFGQRLQLNEVRLKRHLMESILQSIDLGLDASITDDDFAAIMWYYDKAVNREG